MANFDIAFKVIIGHEGGYVNDPLDRGGETYAGITRKNYPKWEGWALIDARKPEEDEIYEDMKPMVKEFYRTNYWSRIGEITSQVIATFTFDWKINSGNKSIRALQSAVGTTPDGKLGSVTIAAANACNESELLAKLKAARIAFYHGIVERRPSQKKYINGWVNRTNSFTA